MKKIILFAGFVAITVISYAQEKGTNDLGFSVGLVTTNDFLKTTEDIINGIGGVTKRNTNIDPAFNLTYKRTILNNWSLYAEGTYQTMQEDVFENSIKTGDVSYRYITIGFGTEYHYVHKEWFQMYSGASIAYTFQNTNFNTSSNIKDDSDNYFNFQVNLVGLRVGKKLAGFIELGVGYKGYTNLGLSYQF